MTEINKKEIIEDLLNRKIKIIPKIHIRVKETYIENSMVCVTINELYQSITRNMTLLALPYFKNKTIILSAIVNDEQEIDFREVLFKLPYIQNLAITTCDGPTYDDMDSKEREMELELIQEENELLESFIKEDFNMDPRIFKLLKGSTQEEYFAFYKHLQKIFPLEKKYLIYLSGPIRSSFHFDALTYLREKIPFFKKTEHELYLYGCNPGSIKNLHTLLDEFNVQGIITESHLADAKYRGHRKYSFAVRIQKAWEKYLTLFLPK